MTPRALVFSLLAAACSAEIEHGVPAREADRMLTALAQAGISGDKEAESTSGADGTSYTIRVPASEVAHALQALRAAELPRTEPPGLDKLVEKSSLVPTALEEHARLASALAGDLVRTLESMDGVISARVHLPVSEGAHASAAVLLRVRAAGPPIADVQAIVAGAGGLAASDVRVVVTRAAQLEEAAAGGSPELVALGPLRVERASRRPLQLVFALLLSAVLALSVVLLALARRMARLRERVAALERAEKDRPANSVRGVEVTPQSV